MNEADDNSDKNITNNNVKRTVMDQVSSQSTSSLQKFELAIKATPNTTDTNTDDAIDHKWYPHQKSKNHQKFFQTLKNTRHATILAISR
ncbi:hypothetical protein RhiirA5_440035 [Rhizophagus irregularis]|uniref:Uncharacterized protein n=1 Tax=Rhizophagus irregularis TaxID=588596 RepID=A0A2N0NH68_9GLOM|nr:hypothetical protein RhiirA5_440035 [Rhizophagus irregularis]